MTPLLKTYLEGIRAEHRKLDARGVMQMHRQVDMALDDIYVTLKASIKRERHAGGPPISLGALSNEWTGGTLRGDPHETFDDPASWLTAFPTEATTEKGGLDIEALYARNRHWVILGDPGSGKTTLLRHQAWKSADDHLDGRGAVVPIYLTLRYFDPADFRLLTYATGPNLEDLGFGPQECQALREEIVRALTEGRALVLCDGLDEQRDAGVKEQTAAAIESLVQANPDIRCMVTSRIVGYDAAPLRRGFQTATLEPFSKEQVKTFFRKWYRAVERAEDLIGAYTEARADRKADEMTEAVLSEANPGLCRLAANPLLCTIIGLIHRQGGALPEQRVELYKLCVDTFIFNWEMHKRRRREEQGGLNPQETQEVLEPIAFHLQEEAVENRAPRETILGWVAGFLVREHGMPEPEARAKAGRLLDLIRDVAGLFIERGAGEYAFFHLSFQEYLCARYITRRRREIEAHLKRRRGTSDRQPHLFDPRWREVIYLAAAYQGQRSDEDASEFVELVTRQTDLMPHEAEMQYAFRMAFAGLRETRVLFQTADEMMALWVRLYLERPYLQERLLTLLRRRGHPLRYRPETFDALLQALRNENTDVLWAAAEALGELKDPRALEPLLEALRDANPEVRQAAAEALGEFNDPCTIEPLLQVLRDANSDVRQAAARALHDLHFPRALEPLLHALHDEDTAVRKSVVWALARSKDPYALEPLLQTLRDDDVVVSWVAALALGEWKDLRVLDPLLQWLQDDDAYVRFVAARALGQLKEPRAFEPLLHALHDKDAFVRSAVAGALGDLKNPRAVEPLMQAIRDEDGVARPAAAWALGELKDPRALEPLMQSLRDEDATVGRDVAMALGELRDPRAVEPLMQAIRDRRWLVRWAAARAFRDFSDPRALEPLLHALHDEKAIVRQEAAWALGELKDSHALETLFQCLRDEDAPVRRAAAEAIEKIELGGLL